MVQSVTKVQSVYFFVYGTLKRGQCREKCWPISPLNVDAAWTFGQLYDLGAYPALLVDDQSLAQRVAGELWCFREADLQAVADVLDRIEGTGQPDQPNEYDRVELTVTIDKSEIQVVAHTYVYARANYLHHVAKRMPASLEKGDHRYCVWPEYTDWPE